MELKNKKKLMECFDILKTMQIENVAFLVDSEGNWICSQQPKQPQILNYSITISNDYENLDLFMRESFKVFSAVSVKLNIWPFLSNKKRRHEAIKELENNINKYIENPDYLKKEKTIESKPYIKNHRKEQRGEKCN